jgi:hypothetical protein
MSDAPLSTDQYYVLSVYHTQRSHLYITFWRPDDNGYTWVLPRAGKYEHDHVMARLGYYNSGKNVAIPCAIVDPLAVAPVKGYIDNDAGPVVQNNRDNWKTLLKHLIGPSEFRPRPVYRPTRRTKAAA